MSFSRAASLFGNPFARLTGSDTTAACLQTSLQKLYFKVESARLLLRKTFRLRLARMSAKNRLRYCHSDNAGQNESECLPIDPARIEYEAVRVGLVET